MICFKHSDGFTLKKRSFYKLHFTFLCSSFCIGFGVVDQLNPLKVFKKKWNNSTADAGVKFYLSRLSKASFYLTSDLLSGKMENYQTP